MIMALGRAQVGEWLRSLQLDKYTQSFLDNGYDDMEMCRQIGHPDLDAIGVEDPDDRQTIIDEVHVLIEKDSLSAAPTPVYFILENPEYDDPPPVDVDSSPEGIPPELPPRSHSKSQRSASPPSPLPSRKHHGSGDSDTSQESRKPLLHNGTSHAHKARSPRDYAALPELTRLHHHDNSPDHTSSTHVSPVKHHLGDSRGPVEGASPYTSRQLQGVAIEESEVGAALFMATGESSEMLAKDKTADGGRISRKTSTLGKLFRSRRHSPKYTYRQHQGDPKASEMTMSDGERMQLMSLVRDGKLSQEAALEMVKNYEVRNTQTLQRDSSPGSSQDLRQEPHEKKRDGIRGTAFSNLIRNKVRPFLKRFSTKDQTNQGRDTGAPCTPDQHRKGSLSLTSTPSPRESDVHGTERRGSSSSRGAVETSSGDGEEWTGSRERIVAAVHEQETRLKMTGSQAGEDQDSAAPLRNTRIPGRQFKRFIEDPADLNSDGMSQGESERTASSSLESVHSCAGMQSISSSSSQGSMSLDDPSLPKQPVCYARVIRDYVPSPYVNDVLKLKKGDIVQVLKKSESGTWLGRLENKIGTFKFINIEVLSDWSPPLPPTINPARAKDSYRPSPGEPSMVEALLASLQLQDLVSVFLLNGYITLDDLRALTEDDLDDLQITKTEDRAKVMAAIQLIQSGQAVSGHEDSPNLINGPKLPKDDSGAKSKLSRIPSPAFKRDSAHRVPIQHAGQYSTLSRKIDSGLGQELSSCSEPRVHFSKKLHIQSSAELDHSSPDGYFLKYTDQQSMHHSMHSDSKSSKGSNCDSGNFSYRTFSHALHKRNRETLDAPKHGSPSKIPQMRNRTQSFDQLFGQKPSPSKKVQRSRQNTLASVDSAYSSAPNTPVLQRNSSASKLISSDHSLGGSHSFHSHSPEVSLVTASPSKLVGVKTAHIRALGMSTVSRSAPCSPAVMPKITPAARSSVHQLHKKPGKKASQSRPKGLEARLVGSASFPQVEPPKSYGYDIHSPQSPDTVSIATILTSTGLMQYEAVFRANGVKNQKQFLTLTESDFRNIGLQKPEHIHRLLSWQQHLDPGGGLPWKPQSFTSKAQRVHQLRDKV